MELLQEDILYLEKKIKGIVFDLNRVKAMNMVLYFFAFTLAASCGMLLACSIAIQPIKVSFVSYIITCGVLGLLWYTLPGIIDYNKAEIDKLKSEKFKCETEIENYKQVILKKKLNMKPKIVLTENQLKTLINYGEKAKNYFKWLIVTKDGEVVASDLKPDYDDQWDTWFFNSEANTIKIGSNKKLAKHSKDTLTKVK